MTRLRSWLIPANLIPFGAFLVSFLAFPVRVLGGFDNYPGDVGDSRLNGYFLENIYLFLSGHSPSLWNLGMFSPYPYVIGFSDNLFGAFPAYLVPRLLTGDPSLSMVVWWYVGWIANFVAAYFALRKLSLERIGATVGAMIFTFALPLSNCTFNWVQLDYRFGLPLAVAAWVVFLQHKSWTQLVVAAGWTVWQFYCTIYIGVFTLILIICITAAYFVVALFTSGPKGLVAGLKEYGSNLVSQGRRLIIMLSAALVALAAAMILLMWPYLKVTKIYGFVRTYLESLGMIPTVRSYLLADNSWLWGGLSAQVASSSIRWEQQMFPGGIVLVLALIGILVGLWRHNDKVFAVLLIGIAGVVVITLNYHGNSLWEFMSQLPLFSAIRAVARIIVAMLFLLGYLAGYGADALFRKGKAFGKVALALLCVALVVEFACVSPNQTPRVKWKSNDTATAALLPANLPQDSILFFAQSGRTWYESEVNAIWGALRSQHQTINGYSGNTPNGFSSVFGTSCSELPRRVLSYLSFNKQSGDIAAYRALMSRMVPIGFGDCDPGWWQDPPATTRATADLSQKQLAAVNLTKGQVSNPPGWPHGAVTVQNSLPSTVSAEGEHQLRIAWRYVGADGVPLTDFIGRANLPFDLKSGASVDVYLSLDPSRTVKGGSIELTVLEEGLMRASDAGVQPLSIKIND